MDFDVPDRWPEAVVIFSTRDDVVAGYNPRLQLVSDGASLEVHWREGFHDRCFPVAKQLAPARGGFRFRDGDGHAHELVPMTLELYREHVRTRTMGSPDFDSLSELLDTMRKEW